MTARARKFLFIYNDTFGRSRETDSAEHATQVSPIDAATILGMEWEDLKGLRCAQDDSRVFCPRPHDGNDEYLTTVQVRTLLAALGVDFVSLGESDLFERSARLRALRDEEFFGIGLSTTFIFEPSTVNRLLAAAKEQLPSSATVVGGAGITLNPQWFERIVADYGVVGDAEPALASLVRLLQGERVPPDDVPGLLWRAPDGSLRENDRVYYPIDDVPTPIWGHDGRWPTRVWYESIRGCPFTCKFCSYPQQSPKWRYKSAERMCEEWVWYASQGVRQIVCLDSTMLTPPSRMKRFCELLAEARPGLTWACWGHPSQLQDKALLRAMHAAGCRSLAIGVESADEQILKNMQKQISVGKAIQAVRNVMDAGILATTHFMAGFPGETERSLRNTYDFLKTTSPDFYTWQVFQIRDQSIPILKESADYGLEIAYDAAGAYESWQHASMSSVEALQHLNSFKAELQRTLRTIDWYTLSNLRLLFQPEIGGASHQYYRRSIIPIIKDMEGALLRHPETHLYEDVQKDLAGYEEHAGRARRRLRAELEAGNLVAGAA